VNEEQRAEEFKEALRIFLSQYNEGSTGVMIEVEEDRRGRLSMEVYLPTVWGDNDEVLKPGVTVNLGTFFP